MSNPPADPGRCAQCGTEMAPTLLCCPGCGRLVHADELKSLANEAEQAELSQDLPVALAAWRRALELLPVDSRQRNVVTARIDELGRRSPESESPSATPSGKARAGSLAGLGAVGLLIWKFKFIAVFVLTKAKF